VGGGLMLKSFWLLAHADPGFEPEGALTAQIDPSGARYESFAGVTTFYQELLERVRAIPGVTQAGLVNSLRASFPFSVDEHPPLPPEKQPSASLNQVSADYFRAMGIPLRAGRFFTDRDVRGAQPVVIVDESFARHYFAGEDPVGKHVTCKVSRDAPDMSYEIVGVVGGAKYWDLTQEPTPHMYYSYLQDNWTSMELVVRGRVDDPMKLAAPTRAALAAIDPNQPIHSFRTLESNVSELVAPQRFTSLLLAGFAALAALLAAIGLYGVVSYTVAQRTREIGIRMALGARASDVLRMVVLQGMLLTLAGVGAGLLGALALTRLMSSLLYGVTAHDPLTLAGVTLLLAAVALAACLVPARRAAKVDPMVALRYE
jgi:predicted permease